MDSFDLMRIWWELKHETLLFMKKLHEDDIPDWISQTNEFRKELIQEKIKELKTT